MSDAEPRLAEPRVTQPEDSRREGRIWLTYPELCSPGLVHGIVVFEEFDSGVPYDRWTGVAADFLRRHLLVPPAAKRPAPEPVPDPGQASGVAILLPRQVHGNVIRTTDADSAYPDPNTLVCDGLATNRTDVVIGVSVADCIPLFAADIANRVIGVAHCGWKGIASGIVEELVGSLRKLGGDPRTTRCLIGPGIGRCCYEVGGDLLREFPSDEVSRFSQARRGATFFDLKQVVAARLAGEGVDTSRISIDKTCTSCQKYAGKRALPSYRRDGNSCGRIVAVLGLSG
ncbi:MAG: polyphenol oxidase family protein [Candidatus Eisenbacteria bacterium]